MPHSQIKQNLPHLPNERESLDSQNLFNPQNPHAQNELDSQNPHALNSPNTRDSQNIAKQNLEDSQNLLNLNAQNPRDSQNPNYLQVRDAQSLDSSNAPNADSSTHAPISTNPLNMLEKAHLNLLKKLKISDILSLVIHFTPKSYNDTTLSTALNIGTSITTKVQITATQGFGYGKSARLKIFGLLSDFNEAIVMNIFHAKPFHKLLFKLDATLFIQGKLELYNHTYTINQPKVISQIDTISLKFKASPHNAKSLQELLQAAITLPNLRSRGLPESIATKIIDIFHPSHAFVARFQQEGGFDKAHLDALKFAEMYHYLQKLSRKKRDFKANFVCENDISDFIKSLPFTLTSGQKGAISDIIKDLSSSKACRRLIQGDVGCGKTLVILCAVMCAYPHRSILMCPTTILAKQIYVEAKKYLPSFVEVELITAQSPKEAQDSLFHAHFVIGTQALLYRDLNAEKIALVMSDEQHRFGVRERNALEKLSSPDVAESSIDSKDSKNPSKSRKNAKESAESTLKDSMPMTKIVESSVDSAQGDKDSCVDFALSARNSIDLIESTDSIPQRNPAQTLESSLDSMLKQADSQINSSKIAKLPARPHALQFSATPIPRTLAMINSHFIDVSVIKDLPFEKDIDTRIVGKQDFKVMLSHLKSEVALKRQVIIVYPLIEESEHLDYLSLNEGLGFWQRHFEGVYSTSGKDKDKQNVIDEFAKNGSVLLSTTVIEVGISLPRVSSIVIVAPERLGLATLHQLRGRVSRNGLKGYCYLYTHKQENARLEAFAKTMSGFEIAELDLAYRSSGDLLEGKAQSGDEFIFFDIASDMEILKNVQETLYNATKSL